MELLINSIPDEESLSLFTVSCVLTHLSNIPNANIKLNLYYI